MKLKFIAGSCGICISLSLIVSVDSISKFILIENNILLLLCSNNFNLFYESNVGRNELERTLVWYKLVFHQTCKFSFNIIPNNESDRYELEVYKADVNFDVCTGEITTGFSKQDSISKMVSYTDSAQSATFRGSLFHTREFEVGYQEVVYIVVNNLSGPDLGFVIDLQTCDYSYILKMNKEAITDQQKINRTEFETPFSRLKAISRKICNTEDDKKLGYSSFLGDNMKVKNFSARSLDSASKQQAKAVRILDSLAKRPLASIPKKQNLDTSGMAMRAKSAKAYEAAMKKGNAGMSSKNYDEAISGFTEALKLKPEDAAAKQKLAEANAALEKENRSEEHTSELQSH